MSHRSTIKRDTRRRLYFPLLLDSVRYLPASVVHWYQLRIPCIGIFITTGNLVSTDESVSTDDTEVIDFRTKINGRYLLFPSYENSATGALINDVIIVCGGQLTNSKVMSNMCHSVPYVHNSHNKWSLLTNKTKGRKEADSIVRGENLWITGSGGTVTKLVGYGFSRLSSSRVWFGSVRSFKKLGRLS